MVLIILLDFKDSRISSEAQYKNNKRKAKKYVRNIQYFKETFKRKQSF